MFAIRRAPLSLSRPLAISIRGNASIPSSSTEPEPSKPPPPPEQPTTTTSTSDIPFVSEPEQAITHGRRKRKILPKRPSISLANPRTWNRPLKEGVVPAYDLALRFLQKDSMKLKVEVKEFRQTVDAKQDACKALEARLKEATVGSELHQTLGQELEDVHAELEGMLKRLNILEVQSEINLPDVRWTVNNAMTDMAKPSHRHLMEQKWRKDGDLDLLMERIYQMNVVPDVLPVIKPSIDLHVIARTKPSEFIETEKMFMNVEPGVFLRPKQTIVPPKLRVNVFHTDTRLYTMLLVDPDVPNPESESFTTFLHWMKPNIALSATSSSNITNLNTHTKYIPPHPQRGTPYHRYVCLLLPQPPLGAAEYTLITASRANDEPTSVHLDIPPVSMEERLGFDVRAFAQRWNLDAAKGGGAHMWRAIWDDDVSHIYKTVLKIPEPRYGRPPKVDVYAQMNEQKKYIS